MEAANSELQMSLNAAQERVTQLSFVKADTRAEMRDAATQIKLKV